MELVSNSHSCILLQLINYQGNAWSTLEDMVIGGFIAYLGHDSHAKALSTIWAGSNFAHRMLQLHQARVDGVLDIIVMTCK